MQELTNSQINLLYLCKRELGPTITEMHKYGSGYDVSSKTLREDLIILLQKLLVWPISFIDPRTYLPRACLITIAGEELLQKIHDEEPTKFPRVSYDFLLSEEEINREEDTRDWPSFQEMSGEEIAALADVYTFWAQSPDTRKLRTPKDQLFNAAAKGYAKLNDTRRFSVAVRGSMSLLEEQGRFLELLVFCSRTTEKYDKYSNIVLSSAGSLLEKPYFTITGKSIPELATIKSLKKLIREFARRAVEIGRNYDFKLPDGNSLKGISNRVYDIVSEAFKTSNRALYLKGIHVEYLLVELCESIVEERGIPNSFKGQEGYELHVGLAEKACLLLESYADLINLEEQHKKTAYKKILEVIGVINRLAVVPVWNVCDSSGSNEDRAGHWIFDLLRSPDISMRARLSRLSSDLKDLHANLQVEEELRLPSLSDPAMIKPELEDIKSRIAKIDMRTQKIEKYARTTQEVEILVIKNKLAELLALSQTSLESLEDLSTIVLQSKELLKEIDVMLKDDLPLIRQDIENWRKAVKESVELSSEERKTFLRELGEIMKISSVGELLFSIPLIPGFLQYRYRLRISTDWNKWIGKLRHLLGRS